MTSGEQRYYEVRMLVAAYAKRLVENAVSYAEWMRTMDRIDELRREAERAWNTK